MKMNIWFKIRLWWKKYNLKRNYGGRYEFRLDDSHYEYVHLTMVDHKKHKMTHDYLFRDQFDFYGSGAIMDFFTGSLVQLRNHELGREL